MHYVFLFLVIALAIPALICSLKARKYSGEYALSYYATACTFWGWGKFVLVLWFFYWLMTQ